MKKYFSIIGATAAAAVALCLRKSDLTTQGPVHVHSPASPAESASGRAFSVPASKPVLASGGDSAAEGIPNSKSTSESSIRNLPERIQKAIENKAGYPSVESVADLDRRDEGLLIRLYADEKELTNKLALTWSLAAVGGDDAARTLEHTLLTDYNQTILGSRESELLRDTLIALGFVSGRSGEAYDFLVAASLPEYWEKHRTWRGADSREEAYSNARYAKLATQALGASLNPEVSARLEKLKEGDAAFVKEFSAPIVEAAFYFDTAKQRGTQGLLNSFLSGSVFAEYLRWRDSAEGKAWVSWRQTVDGPALSQNKRASQNLP